MSASRDLSGTVRMLFRSNSYQQCYSGYRYGSRIPNEDTTVRYMEIPVSEDVFEIPIFAFKSFVDSVKEGTDSQAIAVMLNTEGRVPKYKSVDRYMRDVLLEGYKNSRLVKLEVKQGNDTIIYYGTQGAVFDKNFKPLAICSYQLEREKGEVVVINSGEQDQAITRYKFLRPILRVDPYAYLWKVSPMERFIVNKLMNTCLDEGAFLPMAYDVNEHFDIPSNQDTKKYPVKIEIDECPFLVHQTATPSISTDNRQLLQLAIDHIDELIQ